MYKVLWFDDQYEELENIIDEALEHNIELIGFNNAIDGINELENNYQKYNAIILDGMFYYSKENIGDDLDNKAFGNVAKAISDLKAKKIIIPWFTYSGQNRFVKDKDSYWELLKDNQFANGKIFDKNKDEDFTELCSEIIKEAKKLPQTQIKLENERFFSILENDYNEEVRNIFLEILLSIKNGNIKEQLYFTQIRKVLEYFYRNANKYGFLHDKCVQKNGNQVNLSESSLFLSGKETKYYGVTCTKAHFSKFISNNVWYISTITSIDSHTNITDVTENIDIQQHRKMVKTPYLLYSITYQLMDIIVWLDEYFKLNPDIEFNKTLWKELDSNQEEWINGFVESINPVNDWGTFKSEALEKTIGIPPYILKDNNLKVNNQIEITLINVEKGRIGKIKII